MLKQTNGVTDWLLELDPENPGVRYFALRDLRNIPEDDRQVREARRRVMRSGPVPDILDAQRSDGTWVKSGSGYSPKYRSTVWQILFLAELGADPADARVRKGCEALLRGGLASNGAFSAYARTPPSGAFHCLNGNMLYALQRLGFGGDPRVRTALQWQAGAILGEADIEFYKSGTSGPGFACGVNLGQPCGWGAAKAMNALLQVPPRNRTQRIKRALQAGADFLLSRDPVEADYPYTDRVSSTWFKPGFPLSYWSDVVEITWILVRMGYAADPRLRRALNWILEKRDDQGRWKLANSLNGKMWIDIEGRGKPSKWVTLRALRVLKGAGLLDGLAGPSNS
ncbi:MAG TPA: hypothetical protein VJK02_25945 [Anaerolineales bacterium]|nr:hypothetical protein [Anaerolineales bacterium]